MENTTKKQSSTASKVFKFGCLPVIAIIVVFIITVAILMSTDEANNSDAETVEVKEWSDMTYEEHEAWIKKYLDNSGKSGFQLEYLTNESIKKKFNYPEEVEFDNWVGAKTENGIIVEADSGWVFCPLRGTAKNAFGVKSRFAAQVKWKITTDEIRILRVEVREGN